MNEVIADVYPLSPMQTGLLFQTLAEPDHNLYIEQLQVELDGPLNFNFFQQAWSATVQVYPMLRTVFDWTESQAPVQVVLNTWQSNISYIDYSQSELQSANTQWQERIKADRIKPFKLDTRPPIRIYIARTASDTHRLLISYHHIILDGNSIAPLLQTLASEYNARLTGVSPKAVSSPSYKEYVEWITKQDKSAGMEFWRNYLTGKLRPPQLPAQIGTGQTQAVEVSLPYKTMSALLENCKLAGVTPSVMLQVLWAEVLSQTLMKPELMLGIPTSILPSEQRFNGLVGLSISTMPVLIKLSSAQPVNAAASQLQQRWGDILENAHLSLGEIESSVGYRSMTDPFDSLFTYSNKPEDQEPNFKDISWSLLAHDEITPYGISTDAVITGRELILKITYRDTSLSADAARKLLMSFQHGVTSYCENENRSLVTISAQAVENEANEQKLTSKMTSKLDTDSVEVKRISQLWQQTIGVSPEPNSNFFSLGGDSIGALQLASAMQKDGLKIRVKDIFDNPTPMGQAKMLSDTAQTTAAETNPDQIIADSNIDDLLNEFGSRAESVFSVSDVQRALLTARPSQQYLYHDQSTFSYEGEIDRDKFEQAWNRVISRNASLRTVFRNMQSDWYQVELQHEPIRLTFHDLSTAPEDAMTILNQIIQDDRKRSYDYSNGPLIRLTLCKTSPSSYVFFLSFNVIIMDGWCFAFVLKEFVDEYTALVQYSEINHDQRPSYKNYINWLERQSRFEAKQYWADYLAGANISHLPRVITKETESVYEVTTLEHSLSTALSSELIRISGEHHVTANTAVQVSWAFVMRQYSTNDMVLFGATIAGRPAEVEGGDRIIGLFFNDLPIHERIDLSEDRWLLARRLQTKFQASINYGYLSTKEIKEAAGINSEADIFQSLLVFENYPKVEEATLKANDRQFLKNTAYWRRDMSDIDLTLYVEISIEGIHIKASYLTGILKQSLVATLISSLESQLQAILA